MADHDQTTTQDHGDEQVNPVEETVRLVPVRQLDGTVIMQPLPPIEHIVIPKCKTKSATIRWLWAMGYPVKEIYNHLGCKYQMVRNIVTTLPKRAAREDLPKLEVEYRGEPDDVQLMMDDALDKSLAIDAKERRKESFKARNHDYRDHIEGKTNVDSVDEADIDHDAAETEEQ